MNPVIRGAPVAMFLTGVIGDYLANNQLDPTNDRDRVEALLARGTRG